jgi:hypothetical protein
MSDTSSGVPAGLGTRVREAVSDAIGYWEPRRIVYNAVLTLIVLVYFAVNWPHSRTVVSFEGVLVVFVLAVLANICYCAADLGDVFVQNWHGVRGDHHSMGCHHLLRTGGRGMT